jgi:hypothetical protein
LVALLFSTFGLASAQVPTSSITLVAGYAQTCNQVTITYSSPVLNKIDVLALPGYNIVGSRVVAAGISTFTMYFDAVPQGTELAVRLQEGYAPLTASYSCSGVDSPNIIAPENDADGDGVLNGVDNCIFVHNRDQANGWGGPAGDACDTLYYDSGRGYKVFPRVDKTVEVFGDCAESKCRLIGTINQRPLRALAQGEYTHFQTSQSLWSVDVYFMAPEADGARLYQVNVYDANGTLLDDRLMLRTVPGGNVFLIPR